MNMTFKSRFSQDLDELISLSCVCMRHVCMAGNMCFKRFNTAWQTLPLSGTMGKEKRKVLVPVLLEFFYLMGHYV